MGKLSCFFCAFACVLLSAQSSLGATCGECSQNSEDTRLPQNVVPELQELDLVVPDPNTHDLSYKGTVNLHVVAREETCCITMHSHLLTWNSVRIETTPGLEPISVANVSFNDNTTQFAVISLTRSLAVDERVRVEIAFTGQFNHGPDGGAGFFLSNNTYDPTKDTLAAKASLQRRQRQRLDSGNGVAVPTRHHLRFPPAPLAPWQNDEPLDNEFNDDGRVNELRKGTQQMMYGTQFEESDARRTFPCFDEPAFKTRFKFSITVPVLTHAVTGEALPDSEQLTALANTQEVGPPEVSVVTNTAAATRKHMFKETLRPMSSYLVALAVGHFDYVEAYDRGVRHRVYTPVGYGNYGKFALDIAVRSTRFFDKSFGLEYAEMNEKMDQIAVPSVADNAMENWGLLCYDPAFLLAPPPSLSTTTGDALVHQQFVASVVAHEISHQWFGDTVTNEWWSQEYFQEGWARLLQYTAVVAINPSWDMFNGVFTGSPFGDFGFFGWPYNSGMSRDFDGSLPAPLVRDDETPSGTAFYEKGASINRMFETYLGDDVWFTCLTHHLQRNEWTNPQLPQLLASFRATLPSHLADTFPEKMRRWITQAGMPLVTLTVDDDTGTVHMTQRPSAPATKIDPNQRWWLPLHVKVTARHSDDDSVFYSDNVAVDETVAETVFFDTDATTASLPIPKFAIGSEERKGRSWLLGNYNFSAFVLVNYSDPAQWQRITEDMAKATFPIIDRQQLTKQLSYLAQLENMSMDSDVTGGRVETATSISPSARHLLSLPSLYQEMLVPVWESGLTTHATLLSAVRDCVGAWAFQFARSGGHINIANGPLAAETHRFLQAIANTDRFTALLTQRASDEPQAYDRDSGSSDSDRELLVANVLFWDASLELHHDSARDYDTDNAALTRYSKWSSLQSRRQRFATQQDLRDAALSAAAVVTAQS